MVVYQIQIPVVDREAGVFLQAAIGDPVMHTFEPTQHHILGRWGTSAEQFEKAQKLRSLYPRIKQPAQATLLNEYKAAVNEDHTDQAQYLKDRGTELYGQNFLEQVRVIDTMFADDTTSAIDRSLATLGEGYDGEPEETAA